MVKRERLTRVPHVREVESSFLKGRPNLTQCCKRFKTSTQVAVLPCYDAEMGTANSLRSSTIYGEYDERLGKYL